MAILAVGALALSSGCSLFTPDEGPATRVVQTVDVMLEQSGKIRSVDSTAVLLDEHSGAVRSEEKTYETDEVASDLPVRVTTKYLTDDGSGSDLQELDGYSGRVEIDVSLENLTIASENLTFDAVGQARTSPALVATPLSIAASATLPGTSTSAVVFDADSERRTNGVVSSAADDSSLVQWGTMLAPPQTQATATLRLVADVEDFTVPEIDISVQAGLHTDLSFEGALAAAVDSSPTSPLGMQQQAISVVADVNDVLTRAGETVTGLRENLNDTSSTLGARASQRLNDSSKQLTAEMEALGTQFSSLESGLSGTVQSTASSMNSELTGIVNTMSGILGNTRQRPPELFEGEGCSPTLKNHEPDGTIFSMFLYLSALLDGYADASAECQKLIVEELNTAVGPEEPTDALCAREESVSATCALHESKMVVQTSMEELAERGAELATELRTDTVDEAHRRVVNDLEPNLLSLRELIGELQSDGGNREAWEQIEEQIQNAKTASTELKDLRGGLEDVSARLNDVSDEQSRIATEICKLDNGAGGVDTSRLDDLSAQITGLDCEGEEVEGWLPWDAPINDLPEQAAVVDQTVDALNSWDSSSSIHRLDSALAELERSVQGMLRRSGRDSISPSVAQELWAELYKAEDSTGDVKEKIEQAQLEQDELGDHISEEFKRASEKAGEVIEARLDGRVEVLSDSRDESLEEIGGAYADLITSLRASSTGTRADGKTLVDEQQASLDEQHAKTTESLNERTTAALESIERSTTASTRDVEAASAQLNDSLNKVLLDLGDPEVEGSGILGAMSASAARSDTADYQLAQASQHASGYANVRDEDIAGILLRNAQFRAALEKTDALPPFHLQIPQGATSQTIYTFSVPGGDR